MKCISKNCFFCGKRFFKKPSHGLPYWNNVRKFCSYSCLARSRKPYERTLVHRLKMADLMRKMPEEWKKKGGDRLKKINLEKKGKTVEQIYGNKKGKEIREFFKKTGYGMSNPNWHGGVAKNLYPKEFLRMRDFIKKRDGFICKNCGESEITAKKNDSLGRGLTIHHIDHDRSNNKSKNLITLCKKCNSFANKNINLWIKKYTKMTKNY